MIGPNLLDLRGKPDDVANMKLYLPCFAVSECLSCTPGALRTKDAKALPSSE